MEPFFPMLKAVAAREDLSMPAKLVHACLSAYAGLPQSRPSQDRIAADMGLCRKSVSRAVQELAANNLLVVNTGRPGRASTYQLARTWDSQSRDSQSHRDSESHECGTLSPNNVGLPVPPLEGEESTKKIADEGNQWERVRWIQSALAGFMPEWGKPDVAICRKVDAALKGRPLEDLRDFLERLHASGRKPGSSWAWFVTVIGGEFGEGKR